ncbi:uncharacterized protein TNCV_3864631 [Trichonephila clavipes]|nr:uncharacterized protein TNCV_3864631 [Trichonephila clavipes]
MLNPSLTSIENLRNNFANIKEEAIALAKKWAITPEFEKKRHRKVRQFFDNFHADEKLQDRERLFEVDVFKANVDVITTQLKNRFESMNGICKSFSFLSPKNIASTTNDLLYNEASNLQKVYSLDLSSEFPNQIMSLKAVFSEDLIKLNSIKDLDTGCVAAVAEWYRYRIVVCLFTSSSPVPLKTHRVGQRYTLNLSRGETSSRWCGVVVRRGGVSSGVVHIT